MIEAPAGLVPAWSDALPFRDRLCSSGKHRFRPSPDRCTAAVQASHDKLSATISEQNLLPPQVFTSLLAKIYKRKK